MAKFDYKALKSKPKHSSGSSGKPGFAGKKPFTGKPGGRKPYQAAKKEEKPKVLTRQDRKELKKKRKAQKKNADVADKVNTIYSKNISQLSRPERIKMASEVVQHAKGKIFELSFRHDTSRALQLILKHGTTEQRALIFNELKGHFLELAKNRTGTFLILKVSQYCTSAHKEELLLELRGQFRRLALLNDSAQVLDHLYASAPNHLKYVMIRELLDKSFGSTAITNVIDTLQFKTEEASKIQRRNQLLEDLPQSIRDVAEWDEEQLKKNPDKILAWLIAKDPERRSLLFDSIEVFLNRAIEKENLMYRFMHPVLLQYLQIAPITMSSKRDLISACCNYLLSLHESKEGAHAACIILGYATARDRKNAIRYIKGRVMDLALHPTGYLILLKLIHVTDDSVLLRKQIFNEFTAQAPFGTSPYLFQMLINRSGAKIILYLFNKEHTSSIFTQEELDILRPVFVPAWVLQKKPTNTNDNTANKDDDGDDNDESSKSAAKGGKTSEKDYDTAMRATEKERLQRKLDDEKESANHQGKDIEMVKTSKKDIQDKVVELSSFIVKDLLQVLLLPASHVMGIQGIGTLSTSNIDLTKVIDVDNDEEDEQDDDEDEDDDSSDENDKKSNKDDDSDNEDEDDDEDSSSSDEKDDDEPISHLRQDLINKLPTYAVLDGITKDRVGMETLFAILHASLERFNHLQAQNITKGFAQVYSQSNDIIMNDILPGLIQLSQTGEFIHFNPNLSRQQFQQQQQEKQKSIIQTTDGVILNDTLHPFGHGKAHLFYKRLVSNKGLPSSQREIFTTSLWDELMTKKSLLQDMVTQNRCGFVLASLIYYNENIKANAVKSLTSIIGAKVIKQKGSIVSTAASAASTSSNNKKKSSSQEQLAPGLDALYRVLLGGHAERDSTATATPSAAMADEEKPAAKTSARTSSKSKKQPEQEEASPVPPTPARSSNKKRRSMEPSAAADDSSDEEAPEDKPIVAPVKRTRSKKSTPEEEPPATTTKKTATTTARKTTAAASRKSTLVGSLKLNLGDDDSDDDNSTKKPLLDEEEPQVLLTPRRSARLRGVAPPAMDL